LITVASAERNEASDGQPRINLNDDNLPELERRLNAVFDASWTRFILSYRQFGPYTGPKAADPNLSITVETSKPAQARIASLLDLIGAKVLIPPPGGADEKQEKVLASPWANDPIAMRDYLPKLLDRAAVVPSPVVAGRVNVNLAPRVVLRAVPGMDSDLVERILAARGSRLTRDDPSRRHPTWLLTEGLVDLTRMRTLLRYLGTGGDVQRAQVIGFFDQPGPSLRAGKVPLNTWTFIAGSYDNNTMTIYVNGVLAGSKTVGPQSVANSSSSFRIGLDDNGNVDFSGLIDEVRVYNQALSGDEIRSLGSDRKSVV
jgi:hypothetical protein